ncbi:hypothetical protein PGH12_01480 [Chryseobacterium wangxinyae]|uniref:hypothetical protein n=1 Tax=Chryseobacterium sp. CY350 TaxID=2997336 RepID=UPI00226E692B|nr:hypothetical protein [Chryseobacterium sp. CY350]WBZ95832.1 hypothetical protein PGH12_01480 [Chryseobacterium sp. CY350]
MKHETYDKNLINKIIMEFEQTEQQQLTEFELSEFENTIGLNLSTDIIQHYLNYNSGYPAL